MELFLLFSFLLAFVLKNFLFFLFFISLFCSLIRCGGDLMAVTYYYDDGNGDRDGSGDGGGAIF